MKLIEALLPDVRKELERCGFVELVSVSVTAVPDPDKEEEELAYTIEAYVGENFRSRIPAIDQALDAVDALATAGDEDFSPALRDKLCRMIRAGRAGPLVLHQGEVLDRPVGSLPAPEIPECAPHPVQPDPRPLVWSIGWSVATDDTEGDPVSHRYNLEKLLVYEDEGRAVSEFVDEDSWTRIRDRIRRIDFIIGGMVEEMMGVEGKNSVNF
jgi:hypothetical protein